MMFLKKYFKKRDMDGDLLTADDLARQPTASEGRAFEAYWMSTNGVGNLDIARILNIHEGTVSRYINSHKDRRHMDRKERFKQTMINKYGSFEGFKAHMRQIAATGGGHGKGGFADKKKGSDGLTGAERASKYGQIGGRISRRGKDA